TSPSYKYGYELPFCLVGGALSPEEHDWLRSQTLDLSIRRGFDAAHGIAFMAHMLLLTLDLAPGGPEKPPTVNERTWGDLVDHQGNLTRDVPYQQIDQQRYSFSHLRQFWSAAGEVFTTHQ